MSSLEHEPVHRTASARFERPGWLDYEEFPFDTNAVEIDGNLIHYIDEGTGPTLLFVHAPLWSFVFRDVIEDLRHDFRCIALDFPGSGLSKAAPDYEPTIESASSILESFVNAISIDDATLLVHDVGGPVAFGVAARRPDLIHGIGILGTFGWPLNEEFPDIARFLGIVGSPLFRFLDANLGILFRVYTRFERGGGLRLSRRGRRVFRASYRSQQTRRFATAMVRSVLQSDDYLTTVYKALTTTLTDQPVLLLFGEHDPSREAGFQEKWEALYPEARSETLAGAHHFPMANFPHFVSEVIVDWYTESVA